MHWDNFRITELSRLEKTLKIIQSNHQPNINSSQLHHIPQRYVDPTLKHLEGWGLHHLPGQPIPTPDNPFCKEMLPDIQSKPSLAQLEAITSCPIACYLVKETHYLVKETQRKSC